MFNERYEISIFEHEISKNNQVMVCHLGNGKFVKMPSECWNNIKKYIVNYSPNEICNAADKEDYDYYKKIFEKLFYAKILVKKGEEHLEEVDLVITDRCNLRCIHCCADSTAISSKDSLNTDDWKTVISILEKNKVGRMSITGGEPMVRQDFLEIIQYIDSNFSGTVSLSTNGTLINKENVHIIAQVFNTINISIDGYDEATCSQIRGKGVFEKVIESVELLKEEGFDSNRITLSMVDTVITHNNLDLFYKLCDKINVKPLVRIFSETGRGANENWLKINKEKNEFGMFYLEDIETVKYTDIPNKLCQNCNAGRTRLAITSCGDIIPCVVFQKKEFVFGNILRDKDIINRIWEHYGTNSRDNKELYKDYYFDSLLLKNIDKCSRCDVAPFCHTCIESFYLQKEKYGLDAICSMNKEVLSKIVWK